MAKTVEFNVFRGSERGDIVPDTTRRTLDPGEVFVEISHAGLCGTDRLFKTQTIVLGHEGAGTVRDVGSAVEHFHVGDKVGFGWVQKVCGHCDYCITDKDQYCTHREQYGTHAFEIGAFATHAVWHQSMLVKLPAGLECEYAAPLMCGGATVWSALTSDGIQPGDRVGIAGIGGLGHMAIQFAATLGCDVVAFSSSAAKRDEATALGAKEFHLLQHGSLKALAAPVKHLLWCGSAPPDLSKTIPLVAADGTIHLLTASDQSIPVPVLPLIANGIRLQGSAVASRLAVRRMLRFVTLHGIRPIIMSWPMTIDGIQAAFQTLDEGKMRYRGVLVGQRHLMGKPAVEIKK
ncbi:alcohol dehydrogenase [Penicillium alfredii]|uniref:Alcohol dehydrogenase n=1 Tax=Penicillium alfredii TaxID=1506179 RepID=A0A9W9KRJ6_9EURO|nr:alcohol dehydrogenase [Penicillium alfredii]KAJ5115352.1 alcohol dehydrogenase [Penicillium alfredii]